MTITRIALPGLVRWTVALLALSAMAAHGEVFPLSPEGGDLVGQVQYTRTRQEDTLIDVARRFSIGQIEMVMANPKVDNWLPGEGTQVVIPSRFILPNAPRAGIVVNVPEMRIYYYPVKYTVVAKKKPAPPKSKAKPGAKDKAAPSKKASATVQEVGEPVSKATEVITYPISMGRMDWHTPLGKTRVVQKVKDPVWIPPESIKKEHAAKGEILPNIVPAGPDNPLGMFAMKLGVPGYLIHGTEMNDKSKPFGIGMRVTHGCMRMYNEDVERLFSRVEVGTPVYLVNQPVKLGWQGGALYMEVSQPLDEDAGIPTEWDDDVMEDQGWDEEKIKAVRLKKDAMRSAYLQKIAMDLIQKENAKRPILMDQEAIRAALEKPTGLPVPIGKEAVPLEAAPGLDNAEPPVSLPPAESPGTAPAAPPVEPAAPAGVGEVVPASPYPQSPYGVEPPAPPPAQYPPSGNGGNWPTEDPWTPNPPTGEQPGQEPHAPAPSAPASDLPDPYAPDEETPGDQPEGGR